MNNFNLIFVLVLFRELLLQGWMKPGRDDLAPNVALISKRFNEVNNIFFGNFQINYVFFEIDVSSCYNRNFITTNNKRSCSMY